MKELKIFFENYLKKESSYCLNLLLTVDDILKIKSTLIV